MLNQEDIKKIAQLARLELNDVEISIYQDQLSSVLSYIDELKDLECADSEFLGLSSDDFNRTREDLDFIWDKSETSLALSQAKDKEGKFIKVNRVI